MEDQISVQSVYHKRLAVKGIAVIVAVLFFAGATLISSQIDKHNYIDKKDSPSGIYELLVFDAKEFRDVLSPVDNRIVLQINSFGENLFQGVMQGKYEGITWTSDNSKFLLSTSGGPCNFFIYDVLNNRCNEVGYILDSLFKKTVSNDTGLGLSLSSTSKVDYQFQQWSKDGNNLLFDFKISDSKGAERKGSFWYSYTTDSISGIQLI